MNQPFESSGRFGTAASGSTLQRNKVLRLSLIHI